YSIQGGLSNRHPWSELVDCSAFSKPESVSDATLRIRKNYSYFRTNYLSLITIVLAFSPITNPFSLFLLAGLLAAWLFLYLFRPSDPPLVLFGRQFSERDTLGVLIVSTVVVIFLTSCLTSSYRYHFNVFSCICRGLAISCRNLIDQLKSKKCLRSRCAKDLKKWEKKDKAKKWLVCGLGPDEYNRIQGCAIAKQI
uniref:PRA1 family protein n=1 Tax=Nicotiana sylvestris TaxID=4096 RepID=A0A1U7YCI1_NICSY